MPNKLKRCPICNNYTIKNPCEYCKRPVKDAHYKFIKIRSVKPQESSDPTHP